MAEEHIIVSKKQLPEILLGLMNENEAVEVYGSFWPVTARARNSFMEHYLALTGKYKKSRYDLLQRDDLTKGELDRVEEIIMQDLRREEKLKGLQFYMDAFDYKVAAVSLIIPYDRINLLNEIHGLAAYECDEGQVIRIAVPNWHLGWGFEFNEFFKKKDAMLYRDDLISKEKPTKLKNIPN